MLLPVAAQKQQSRAHRRPNGALKKSVPPEGTRRRLHMAKLNINGKTRDIKVEDDTPLLWVLREHAGLTGTKYGCGIAQCGACSVHVNGEVRRSCSIPLSSLKPGDKIVTIEGLSAKRSNPVQKAWDELDVPQCGYCQSGQIMAATALLKKNPKPTDADIDEAMTNICRCGTYQRVRAGIHRAAEMIATNAKSGATKAKAKA
jgi:isoquinoline 1-oxidoreductase alpha subunit